MTLNFRQWAESIFGQGILQEPEPASEIPMIINKIQNGAFPSYNPTDKLPYRKPMPRKAKKN